MPGKPAFLTTLIMTCLLARPGFSSPPNIVFFYIDDLGWSDLGCQGSDFYQTPNIDRLAADGMVFTDAYACAPNCAPSRACLLSGQYTPRHGIFTVGDPKRGNHRFRKLEPIPNKTVLDDHFVTWAEALDTNGYTSASMGKWHLGSDPVSQGFDLNIAGREWGSPGGGGYHSPYRYPNLKNETPGTYLTDQLTDEAIRFIQARHETPFCLYLTHYAVHTPIQAKAEVVKRYAGRPPGKHHSNAKYAAMIESVDDSVGRILKCLEELHLSDRTLVLFYSDNGGYGGATSNHPLRGAKGMLYEGGIRVPLIVRWPGITKPGSRCDEPVIGVDLYPTLLEVTQTRPPADYEPDGRSLVPLLKNASADLNREAIYWHFPCYLQGSGDPHGGPFRTTPAGAIRKGRFKLIEWFETGRTELYDLSQDISEASDLSRQLPDVHASLLADLRAWRTTVQAPVPTTPNPLFDPTATTIKGKKKKVSGRQNR